MNPRISSQRICRRNSIIMDKIRE